MKFLLLLNLLLLTVTVKPSPTTLRIGVLSDPRITVLSTIGTELVPTLKNLTLDYLVVTGSFITAAAPAPAAPAAAAAAANSTTIQNMKYFFTQLAPVVANLIFWIPGELDGMEVFQTNHLTPNDVNVFGTVREVVPGFYVSGFGVLQDSTEINFSDLSNLIGHLNQSSSVLLLTNKGPFGFSTTLMRSDGESIDEVQLLNPSLWNDTGNQNLTDFLGGSGAQQHVVMNVHGGNPQGVGDTNFENIKIINPGSTYFTKSLVLTEFIKNQMGSWVPNNWKYYRFGNITAWDYKMAVVDTCQLTTVQVAAPYVNDIYSTISIALYSFGIVAILILLAVWVFYSLGQEQV